jgi:hypothetical protein
MRGVISFKWGGDYFIQIFKWGGVYSIQMAGALFHSNGGALFHSNEEGYSIQMRGDGGYFIQIGSANDYVQIILLPKLLSFVKECMIDSFNIIVQEDKALSHAFKHQKLVFMNADVLRLL